MKSKIAFVIPQFGMFPGYIHYFIRSASYLSGYIDFIFLTDQPTPAQYKASNVFFRKTTLEEFLTLSKKKLSFDFTIATAYKLCDMKPMYGLIFEDVLKEYEYWGHNDFDLVLGDIRKLLSMNDFGKSDIFCVQDIYSSGPFQIFRNTDKVNRFFMQSPSWKNVLEQPGYVGFDEAGDVIKELWKGKRIDECEGKIISMTHLFKNSDLLHQSQVTVSMKKLITENYTTGTRIVFDKGKLTLEPANEELFIFHFMYYKNQKVFNDLLIEKDSEKFVFTQTGFRSGGVVGFVWGLGISVVRRYWIRIVRKIKSKIR